jgi:SAM-dependent methyltransferase
MVEFGNLPVYLDVLDELDVTNGVAYLDVACGSGMAIREAERRRATVAGIDAAEPLTDIARERVPSGDIRVGDMCALPWPDDSFDVVTSFNGIWNVETALEEIHRVLRPGGRFAMSFWGDPERLDLWKAWVPAIIELSPPGELESSGDLLRVSEPGEAERLLRDAGFVPGRRGSTLAQAEFVDAELAARAFCSTGPSWAAANHSGEDVLRSRIAELMRPFESPRTGIVRLVNEWAWITARALAP